MLNKKQITNVKTELSARSSGYPLVFQALGDPGRFKMFRLLMKHHNICVTDISNVFSISVSAASQQLKVLERLGLTVKIRMGQMVCYKINNDNKIAKQLIKLLKGQINKIYY